MEASVRFVSLRPLVATPRVKRFAKKKKKKDASFAHILSLLHTRTGPKRFVSVPSGDVVRGLGQRRGRGVARVADRAGQRGADRGVEHAEVDVAKVQLGQQVDGHAVGDHPQVVERVHLDVAGEDQRRVVHVHDAQVPRLVRQPGVPAAHRVPVDQVEEQRPVVAHVVRGDVAAGAAGRQHDEIVVDLLGRERGVAQEPGGHGELAIAGQRVEEQQPVTVLGDRWQRDAEHALLAPLEVDAWNAQVGINFWKSFGQVKKLIFFLTV